MIGILGVKIPKHLEENVFYTLHFIFYQHALVSANCKDAIFNVILLLELVKLMEMVFLWAISIPQVNKHWFKHALYIMKYQTFLLMAL